MKIKTRTLPYAKVKALPRSEHQNPLKPLWLLRTAIRLLSIPTMWKTRFVCHRERMDAVGDQPCLILMNHSCFMDLKIAHTIFPDKPFCIVSTTDGFVGKKLLMRLLGCIPTRKFVTDLTLIRDMTYALRQLKTSVLMFPEAGYTLDGRSTVLPKHLGVLFKRLKVPVVTVTTYGAFARDPLYNGLQIRDVKVHADMKCILTPEEIKEKSMDELDAILQKEFSFDQFAWQRDNKVEIDERFRADGLNRMLYQCPDCGTVGHMEGKGTRLTCGQCGSVHEMDVYGQMHALKGKTRFPHIPDWFDWQREQVRQDIQSGTYRLDTPVDIAMLVDSKALYRVGEGRLIHDENGFILDGCNGELHYEQSNEASYSLNVDYFWYEQGDVISIGDNDALYYCFPRGKDVVTRTRLAAEELHRGHRPIYGYDVTR